VFGKSLCVPTEGVDAAVIGAVENVARTRGVSMAQVALGWVLAKAGVSAPIIGAASPGHVDDAVAALAVKLTAAEITAMENLYVPHPVTSFG